MKVCVHFLLVMCLLGCTSSKPPTVAPVKPQEVTAFRAITSKIVDFREYTGRTAAVEAVEVRARVSGYLLRTPRIRGSDEGPPQVDVDEGKQVKKGDLIFVIDPQPYELALQQSLGALDASVARFKQANNDLTRNESLINSNAISRTDYDQAVASVAELKGQIESLKATIARNKLDLEYTQVRSPIDGLLGSTLVTRGNLVVADSTVLTTVVSINPIYVNFDVDEQSVLDYRKRMVDGKVANARETKVPVRLGLANDQGFPQEGYIDFVNNITDAGTGNTRVRATFDNTKGILSPGLFARIQAPFSAEYEAVLVPTKSIAMDQQGRNVMVVGDDNKISRRAVTIGPIQGNMTVIREGAKAGDLVVTSGLQKIRQGMQVSIVTDDIQSNSETGKGTKAGGLK